MRKHIPSRKRRQLLTTFQAPCQCISGTVSRSTATRAGMWSSESHSKQQTNPQHYSVPATLVDPGRDDTAPASDSAGIMVLRLRSLGLPGFFRNPKKLLRPKSGELYLPRFSSDPVSIGPSKQAIRKSKTD